jgi:amino acid adenylation domain-containing protein
MTAAFAQNCGNQGWTLLLLSHHLLIDHTTQEVVQQEIQAYLAGLQEHLPAPLPFRDFVAQARLGVSREEHEAFFRQMLGDMTKPTLPFGLADARGDGSEIREAWLEVDTILSRHIRKKARALGVSAASIFHLAWGQVLARTSGQDDVVFGTVLFGRMQGGEGVERVLGMFINTLPIRIRLATQSVQESVRDTHVLLTQLLHHEHAPLTLAQHCSGVAAPDPLFTALLNYRHSVDDTAPHTEAESGWQGIEVRGGEDRTNYPVTLNVDDLGTRFLLNAQIKSPIDPTRVCAYMHEALANLIDLLERMPETIARAINVIPKSEQEQVLVSWNDTKASYPENKCIHQLFESQAAVSPEATALIYQDTHLSYKTLNTRAEFLACYLRELGVRPDTRVALCVERSVDMVVALLAILKSGGAYVPLDPYYPLERLTYMVEDSKPIAVISHHEVPDELRRALAAASPGSTLINLDELDWTEAPHPLVSECGPVAPRDLAYVIYTSGSTGKPKGVMLEHRGVVNFLSAMRNAFRIGMHDRVLCLTTIAFDIAGLELYLPLITGAAIVLANKTTAQDPGLLAKTISDFQVNLMQATPATWRMLLDSGWTGSRELVALCGGEALPTELSRRLVSQVGQLWNLYGPTETTIWSSLTKIEAAQATHCINEPIGTPIANTQIYLLDSSDSPVPLGVPGFIYIGGDGVARGYLNQPELTADRFVVNPFCRNPEQRLYKTGDLGRFLPDGRIEFLGRDDFQVKIRGYRIELGEIESCLQRHPLVSEAIVLAREETAGDQRLVAYVVPRVRMESDDAGRLVGEHVAEWTEVWDQTYERRSSTEEESLDLSGWNSSYTRMPLPVDEMRDWLDGLTKRIVAIRPGNVLEVGCGTGMILARIAPHCREYIGTDLSAAAVGQLQRCVASDPSLASKVRVLQGEAIKLSTIRTDCDTVILNSVIQYFPNIDYLFEVVTQAAKKIRSHGRIFIGDVRHHSLLDIFHFSVQLHQSADDTQVSELIKRTRHRKRSETELTVDPAWFITLRAQLPEITDVQILPKLSRFQNEMSAFRYDVILTLRGEAVSVPPINWIDCGAGLHQWEEIRRHIHESRETILGLRAIPNPRTDKEARAYEETANKTVSMDVGSLKKHLATHGVDGVTPGELSEFCESLGYAVTFSWYPYCAYGAYHAIVSKSGTPVSFDWTVLASENQAVHRMDTYANDPLRGRIHRFLPDALRQHASAAIPDYMLPSSYAIMDKMPLTPNGKVNRLALLELDRDASVFSAVDSNDPPVGEREAAIARVWCDVLKLEGVNRHDNFFLLGGHSLLAMKVVNLLKREGIEISVADMFKNPTVATLAEDIEIKRNEQMVQGFVPVRITGTRLPLFLVHENTGIDLWFSLLAEHIDPDIPVYGLPAVPLGEKQLETVEALAARHIRAIRAVQPKGPYRIAGWSLGGILAYEIAAQLIGHDETVAFVGLLDVGKPSFKGRRIKPQIPQSYLLDLCEGVAREVPLTDEQREILSILRKNAEQSQFEEVLQRAGEQGVLHEMFFGQPAEDIQQYIVRLIAHERAVEGYSPQSIPTRIHLFMAQDQPPAPPGAAHVHMMGWSEIIPTRQIELVTVPGNHQSMMDQPHVKMLGEAISSLAEAADRLAAVPELQYRPHVTIQTGLRGCVPIFCIPGAGDNVIGFISLANALGTAWPLYGLQPRGVEGALVPHSSVEAAAAAYRKEIETVQPDGYVHLIGHSFGGWVAFEIAQQLRDSGRHVASLTIIDSEAPDGSGILGQEYTSFEAVKELVRIMEIAAGRSLEIDYSELETQDETGRLASLHAGMVRAGLMPRRSSPDAMRGPLRTFSCALRTAYTPKRTYPEPVRLALAHDTHLDLQANHKQHVATLAGWRTWASQITCWNAPGNHFTVLKQPHVQVLAEWWRGGNLDKQRETL